MKDEIRGPGWLCSILVGLSFLLAGVFLFMDPIRGVTDEAQVWSTLARTPTWSQLRFLSYGLGALAAFGAIPAISALGGTAGKGWLRWTTNLAYLSFAVTAVDNFRLLPLLPRLANAYSTGDAASRAWLLGVRSTLLVDPSTWLKFGALGTWILAVSILAGRAGAFPRGLTWLGVAVAALLFVTVAAMSFGITPLIMFAAGVGGILMLPAWFIWTGSVVRRHAASPPP